MRALFSCVIARGVRVMFRILRSKDIYAGYSCRWSFSKITLWSFHVAPLIIQNNIVDFQYFDDTKAEFKFKPAVIGAFIGDSFFGTLGGLILACLLGMQTTHTFGALLDDGRYFIATSDEITFRFFLHRAKASVAFIDKRMDHLFK